MTHLYVSIFKSIIRIFGCILGFFYGVRALALLFVIAEGFGIIEELVEEGWGL